MEEGIDFARDGQLNIFTGQCHNLLATYHVVDTMDNKRPHPSSQKY